MNNEKYYDEYDEFRCRDLVPLSDKLTELMTDGNRYHYMLAYRLAQTQANRWLVKPATGFVDADHKAFFDASFKLNINRGFYIAGTGPSGFALGNVYAQLDDDVELEVVPDAAQPVWGFAFGTQGKSREMFEEWHLSGNSLRSAWKIQGIVAKVASGDRMYTYIKATKGSVSPADMAAIQNRYPGWLMPDNSQPVLGITGRLVV